MCPASNFFCPNNRSKPKPFQFKWHKKRHFHSGFEKSKLSNAFLLQKENKYECFSFQLTSCWSSRRVISINLKTPISTRRLKSMSQHRRLGPIFLRFEKLSKTFQKDQSSSTPGICVISQRDEYRTSRYTNSYRIQYTNMTPTVFLLKTKQSQIKIKQQCERWE